MVLIWEARNLYIGRYVRGHAVKSRPEPLETNLSISEARLMYPSEKILIRP